MYAVAAIDFTEGGAGAEVGGFGKGESDAAEEVGSGLADVGVVEGGEGYTVERGEDVFGFSEERGTPVGEVGRAAVALFMNVGGFKDVGPISDHNVGYNGADFQGEV